MLSSLMLGLCAAQSAFSLSIPAQRDLEVMVESRSRNDVMVIMADGSRRAMNYSSWAEKLVFEGWALEPPEFDHDWLNFTAEIDVDGDGDTDLNLTITSEHDKASEHDKRFLQMSSCDSNLGVLIDRKETFVDWDVQMSPVDCATNAQMDVQIVKGWSITNSLTVSAGIDYKIIQNVLGVSLGANFARTWQTSDSLYNKGSVVKGECGCMITMPMTTRNYGRVIKGCPGNLKAVGTFSADTRSPGHYDNFEWVSGAVSICAKVQGHPPLSRCNGKGNFI